MAIFHGYGNTDICCGDASSYSSFILRRPLINIVPYIVQLSPNSINCDKEVVFQKLKTRALEDPSCGQKAIIERRVMSSPRREVLVYALITNVIGFGKASKPLEAAFKTNGDLPKREIGFTCWQIPRKRRKHLNHKAKL